MSKLRFGIALFGSAWLAASTISVASAGTVTITAPDNGAAVTSPVTVNAQVDATTCNSGFNHLQVLVNGNIAQVSGNCSMSAPVSLPQGSDVLAVQAIAWDDTVMAQSAISLLFGRPTAGSVIITAPADGALVTNLVTVNAIVDPATCNSGFNHLQVLVNGNI